jgi:hypothetical protein
MNKEFLYMQKLAGIITESEYAAKIEELEVRGKVGKSYPAPTQKPEREISDEWKRYGFLDKGWEFVDLSIPNVKVGDNIVNWNADFGTLKKIKDNKYYVHFDIDYDGEPLTEFTPEKFEEFFLVDKR